MVFSKKLYGTFNRQELEYIALHEAGHCVLWHTPKFGGVFVLLLLSGVVLAAQLPDRNLSLLISMVQGMLFALLFVQIIRNFEREAEEFAASRVSNPRAMITAVEKFKKNYPESRLFIVRRFLLGWNISPEEKIELANRYINRA